MWPVRLTNLSLSFYYSQFKQLHVLSDYHVGQHRQHPMTTPLGITYADSTRSKSKWEFLFETKSFLWLKITHTIISSISISFYLRFYSLKNFSACNSIFFPKVLRVAQPLFLLTSFGMVSSWEVVWADASKPAKRQKTAKKFKAQHTTPTDLHINLTEGKWTGNPALAVGIHL